MREIKLLIRTFLLLIFDSKTFTDLIKITKFPTDRKREGHHWNQQIASF